MEQQQIQAQPIQTVKFICNDWKDLRVLYKRAMPKFYIDEFGRQVVAPPDPDEYIQFNNSVFETSDPEKINFLRNHGHYTGLTDKKVITEAPPADPYMEQLKGLMMTHGAKGILDAITTANPVANTVQAQQEQYEHHYNYYPQGYAVQSNAPSYVDTQVA